MANRRLFAVSQARRLIEELPLTDGTGAARARALSALDDLWDDLVLEEETSGPPDDSGAPVETVLDLFARLKKSLEDKGLVAGGEAAE